MSAPRRRRTAAAGRPDAAPRADARSAAHSLAVVVTCEHASNAVPAELRRLFAGKAHVLRSHRGWDPGALAVARSLARRLGAPLLVGRVSRLVVDLNRSAHHPRVFSDWTRALPAAKRDALRARYWQPFRAQTRALLDAALASAPRVVHLSVHSFTPRLGDQVRSADVGLLYDPRRPREVALADALAERLAELDPALRVRRNYPYRGTADGHAPALRRALPSDRYVALELELSQGLLADARRGKALGRSVTDAVARALKGDTWTRAR